MMETKKGVSGKALKKTLEYVKNNHNRLNDIENIAASSFTCDKAVTKVPDNVQNITQLTSVQGKTLQNLFVMKNGKTGHIGHGTQNDDGSITLNFVSGTMAVAYQDRAMLKPNTVYTLVVDVSENTLDNWLRTSDSFIPLVEIVPAKQTGRFVKVVTSKNVESTIEIYLRSYDGASGSITFKMMILEGDHSNKSIPPYFEGIQSVQNPLDVQVTGKNLFDGEFPHVGYYADNTGGLYPSTDRKVSGFIEVKPNTTYTLSINGNLLDRVNEFDEPIQNSGLVKTSEFPARKDCTFTTSSETKYIQFGVRTASDVEVMLECNSTKTEYESYKQSTNLAIQFDDELRSLPNGVCDEINDGKLIRRVAKINLQDAKQFEYSGLDLTETARIACNFDLGMYKNNNFGNGTTICDKFSVSNGNHHYLDVEHYYTNIGTWYTVYLFVKKSALATQDSTGAREYMKNNPVMFYVELAEPEIIELETIYSNPVIKAYPNGNIIQNNTPIHPTLTFEYNTGLSGKINNLQLEIAQHEEQIKNIVVNDTGLQTVTERVNDLVMQDGNIKLEEMQGNTVQNLSHGFTAWKQFGEWEEQGDYMIVTSLDENQQVARYVVDYKNNSDTIRMLKPSTTYTFIFMEYGIEHREINVCDIDENGQVVSSLFYGVLPSNNAFKFTTPTQPMYRFAVYPYAKKVGDKLRIKNNFMILEGDWTGKEIPAHFTGIKSVNEEQTGLQVRSVGKNLFNTKTPTRTNEHGATPCYEILDDNSVKIQNKNVGMRFQDFSIRAKSNTTYTLSFDSESFGRGSANVVVRLINLHDFIATSQLANHTSTEDCTFTTPIINDGQMLSFAFYNGTTSGSAEYTSADYTIYKNIQVEEGSVATDYEPYKESVITIPYTEPLRKLPNGVCDTIEDGKVIRRVGKKVFNGSESWTMGTIGEPENSNGITRFYITDNLESKESLTRYEGLICDKFKTITSSTYLYTEGIMQGYTNYYFYVHIKTSDLSEQSVNGFKEWLQDNPITIYYELDKYKESENIIEEIPEITLMGYKHLIFDNDIVPNEATISFANSLHSKVEALEKSNASISKQLADIWGVLDVIVLQVGSLI